MTSYALKPRFNQVPTVPSNMCGTCQCIWILLTKYNVSLTDANKFAHRSYDQVTTIPKEQRENRTGKNM
jgi:hypothetical protein